MRRLALATLAALAACNNGEGPGPGFGSSITTAPQGTSSSGDASTSTSTSTSTSSAEDSAAASNSSASSAGSGIPDGGTPPDGGDKPPAGCMGKVDLVFSISSRWTMKGAQDWLKASFPGFVDTLETEFAGFDYHILTPRQYGPPWGIPGCEDCVDTCPSGPEDYPCGAVLEPCDTVQGAGITFSAGWDASNKRCDLSGGHRYIGAGQADLDDAFACVASVGTSGGGLVAEAAVSALEDEINAPAGCNAGFLRDDALLVVVAIDDTWDEKSEGTAKDWADALVEAKGGDADAVVLLVITNDIDDPDGLCGYEGVPPGYHKLRTWTELLPHSVFGSICNDQGYAEYFAAAAAKIKAQCDVFVPQ
ncbi:hypothetical protein [Nannocystis bainbridge]|uniref:Uncharacterized protein n=1 Tax=Nannocystis bainbridge TaxID=2995303 RepID=A0ABT5EBF9_9BACT|nr:hypothetical protein [Nannocystis bainbridge]MDC0723205.1 hypothetical protein [Nannocystis bainbridge]